MLKIQTTGIDDYLDGSANIKALIIGGPGAGKTRSTSYWPKPIYLDCENGRGSLADRNMPYVEIKSSKDMLDSLEYLKTLERTPKAQRQFQTVVIDTADSFQRIVKDEWVVSTKAAAFSGFDAWGYLDTKMQLLFTRLLNLDYNVVVLVHYKDKTYKDGDNTVRELTLQLQGAISDQIFNDFGLVGWLGTYWAPGEDGRVQKRGLTFTPTPDKPFLKDRFNATPKWMEITFTDNDYQQLWEAFYNRPELDSMAETTQVGEIPDSATVSGQVAAPREGGPLAAPASGPLEAQPLEKMLKSDLETKAKDLGIAVRGNMLKSELVDLIKQKQAEPAAATVAPPAAVEADRPAPAGSEVDPTSPLGRSDVASPTSATASTAGAATSSPVEDSGPSASASPSDPWAPPTTEPADNPTALAAAVDAEGSAQTVLDVMSAEQVAAALGGEVIAEERADTPATPQPAAAPSTPVAKPTSAPSGPSVCADCGADLAPEWADNTKKNELRFAFIKNRRYLCTACRASN